MTGLDISYDFEQWRYNNSSGFDASQTGLGGANVSALSGVGTSAGTNGTVQTTPKSISLSGLNIANGATFSISFSWNDDTGSDNGIAIDNFSLSDVVLPIELASFQADAYGAQTNIEWQTVTELNNDHMLIERSQNGVDFKEIGRIQGAGTTYETQNYSFTDRNPANGINYYRLKQVDFDGTFSYSKTISVYFGEKEKVRLYPTLATESVNIEMEETGETNRYVQVYNSAGILVEEIEMDGGDILKSIDVSEYQEGNYFMKIQTGNEVETLRFVKI